jgi:uncharacterized protein YbbK (DUF523 family)
MSDACGEAVVVSACLLGRACRYDGKDALDADLVAQLDGRRTIAVCPEELGGLPTPRLPAELTGGDGAGVWRGEAEVERVADRGNLTSFFVRGALQTLELARQAGARKAVLKENSPSCGSERVRIDGQMVAGQGVTTALLKSNGIEIKSC